MKARAAAGIREILRDHPFVLELFPELERELDTRRFEIVGWGRFAGAVESALHAARPGPAPA